MERSKRERERWRRVEEEEGGEWAAREREDEEKERAEEPMERTRVTEKRNVQSERERWREEKVQADGETRARQLESQAWLSFRCTHLRKIMSVSLNGKGRFPQTLDKFYQDL